MDNLEVDLPGPGAPVTVTMEGLPGPSAVILLADTSVVAVVNPSGRAGGSYPSIHKARKGQPVLLNVGPGDAIELRSARPGRALVAALLAHAQAPADQARIKQSSPDHVLAALPEPQAQARG